MTEADDDELKKLIESNARAIAAVADSLAELRESDRGCPAINCRYQGNLS